MVAALLLIAALCRRQVPDAGRAAARDHARVVGGERALRAHRPALRPLARTHAGGDADLSRAAAAELRALSLAGQRSHRRRAHSFRRDAPAAAHPLARPRVLPALLEREQSGEGGAARGGHSLPPAAEISASPTISAGATGISRSIAASPPSRRCGSRSRTTAGRSGSSTCAARSRRRGPRSSRSGSRAAWWRSGPTCSCPSS